MVSLDSRTFVRVELLVILRGIFVSLCKYKDCIFFSFREAARSVLLNCGKCGWSLVNFQRSRMKFQLKLQNLQHENAFRKKKWGHLESNFEYTLIRTEGHLNPFLFLRFLARREGHLQFFIVQTNHGTT